VKIDLSNFDVVLPAALRKIHKHNFMWQILLQLIQVTLPTHACINFDACVS